MNYTELFEKFWASYGQDEGLDVQGKGSKREGFKAWEKACKKWLHEENRTDESEFSQAVHHGYMLNARNRKASIKAKQFVARLPYLTTYLNQFRFEAEFNTGTAELNEIARTNERTCSCGQPAFGRSESGGWICKTCYIEEWKQAQRETTDPTTKKWLPSEMAKRWPRNPGELCWQWWMRIRNEIIKRAPSTSPLKWKPPERVDDWEYFNGLDGFRAIKKPARFEE
jgi:ribosomal protein L37AE/L43A